MDHDFEASVEIKLVKVT